MGLVGASQQAGWSNLVLSIDSVWERSSDKVMWDCANTLGLEV